MNELLIEHKTNLGIVKIIGKSNTYKKHVLTQP